MDDLHTVKEELTNENSATMQVVEQSHQKGEVWQSNEPETINELLAQIPDDLPKEKCRFHCCLLEHRTSDKGFHYVNCHQYQRAFIAARDEVHNVLKVVHQQRHHCHVINTFEEDFNWPKMLCFCDNPCTLRQNKSANNPGRMFFTCRDRKCAYVQWLNVPWDRTILALAFT